MPNQWHDELKATVQAMVRQGKGVLAADESAPTIAKRFKAITLESTAENRRAYSSLILGTKGLGDFVSSVILFEETLLQRADEGIALPELAAHQGIVPGVKVDAGKLRPHSRRVTRSRRAWTVWPHVSTATRRPAPRLPSGAPSTTSLQRYRVSQRSMQMRTQWPVTRRSARSKASYRSSILEC